jgi:ABC-type Fe3+/spermidine/putrescine transport system ATPase subunit
MIDTQDKSAIIRMFHVYRNYGPKNALIDITLDIFKSEFLFISGPSGAGKTTLLRLLAKVALSGRAGFRRSDIGGRYKFIENFP